MPRTRSSMVSLGEEAEVRDPRGPPGAIARSYLTKDVLGRQHGGRGWLGPTSKIELGADLGHVARGHVVAARVAVHMEMGIHGQVCPTSTNNSRRVYRGKLV